MQATITYLLTEQAQRAQMAATGQPVARKQTISVEISAEDLPLFPVSNSGEITLDLTLGYETETSATLKYGGVDGRQQGSAVYAYTPDQIASIGTYLRAGTAKRAELIREEKERTIANGQHNRVQTEIAFRAFVADAASRSATARGLVADLRSPADFWPEAHADFVAEIGFRNKADSDAKELAKAAVETAKRAYIAEWITQYAEESVRAQFADGLLCRETALRMIADAAFAAMEIGPAYDYTICRNMNCPCGKEELACIPRSVYARWAQIKAKLPEGATVEFLDITTCPGVEGFESEDQPEAVTCAKVGLPHGPFVFTRTIRL